MKHTNDFQMQKPLKRSIKDKQNHNFIMVNMYFYVKFYLRRKAKLVSGGNMVEGSDEEAYCEVLDIENERAVYYLDR